jgi:nonsense-mediated mRNA decay protein 3
MVLKGKFCAKCGTDSEKILIDNLCAECYLELHSVKVPKQKELRVCSRCGSVLIDHFWVNPDKDIRTTFANQIEKNIHVPDNIEIVKLDLVKIKPDGLIEVTFDLKGNVLSKEYKSNLRIQKQLCPTCKQNTHTDHKAILQLRSKKGSSKFISDSLAFMQKHKKKIIKIEEQKTGIDVYLHARTEGIDLARKFRLKFDCHMKETREEYSWNRSKSRPKYKSTVLLTKK